MSLKHSQALIAPFYAIFLAEATHAARCRSLAVAPSECHDDDPALAGGRFRLIRLRKRE